ncbi:hypothetical protein CKQ90_36205, partial [Klebsiella pneumoniae]
VSADNSFSRWSLFGHRQAWRWAEEVIARLGVARYRSRSAPITAFRAGACLAIGRPGAGRRR